MSCVLLIAANLSFLEADPAPVNPPPLDRIEAGLFSWVAEQDANLVAEAKRVWGEPTGSDSTAAVLDAVLRVAFLASDDVRRLVDAASADQWEEIDVESDVLSKPSVVASNLRLFLGKMSVELGAYEEAERLLVGIDEGLCVDPAAVVFCIAVCQHSRLDKAAGLPTIARLLDPGSDVPERYRALARLMKQDLEDLEDNDLAKTAQQMKNLQQKLQRGKSGKKTQDQERQILEKLDKMIEKMEQQQKQAQGQGGQPGNSNNPDNPADDSNIAGQTGPGEVDRRPIGKSSGWGNLPEKSRTEARNLINRQFPSHYRRAVEEYLKKLAERPTQP